MGMMDINMFPSKQRYGYVFSSPQNFQRNIYSGEPQFAHKSRKYSPLFLRGKLLQPLVVTTTWANMNKVVMVKPEQGRTLNFFIALIFTIKE